MLKTIDTNYYFEPSSDGNTNNSVEWNGSANGPDQSSDASTSGGMNTEFNQDGGNDEGVTDGQTKTDQNTSQPNGIVHSEPIANAGGNLEPGA